jgi:hypothetical protein
LFPRPADTAGIGSQRAAPQKEAEMMKNLYVKAIFLAVVVTVALAVVGDALAGGPPGRPGGC